MAEFPRSIRRVRRGFGRSERDIRAHVIKRKIGGGTRSDAGRQCRDAFLGLAMTCVKLGFAFWDYLGGKLAIPGQMAVPYLP